MDVGTCVLKRDNLPITDIVSNQYVKPALVHGIVSVNGENVIIQQTGTGKQFAYPIAGIVQVWQVGDEIASGNVFITRRKPMIT